MGFIKAIIEHYKKRVQERDAICNELISRIDDAIEDAKSIFSNSQTFVDPNSENAWKNRNSDLLADTDLFKNKKLKKASQYMILCNKQAELTNTAHNLSLQILLHNERATRARLLRNKQAELTSTAQNLSRQILLHNEQIARMKMQEAYALIGNIEGKRLDQQQMKCIIKEASNHLVIAGAGTGKTTTVVGKIKYLLKTEKCLPQDILVLSFTNASASEMNERIAAETGQSIAALTFHKLGLNIISQVDGVMPKITQISLRKFVKEQLLLNMQADAYLSLLASYLLYNHAVAKSEFEFKSQEEYVEYLKLNPPTTINHETVKSYGEMDIANFLAQNNVQYIYECPYEFDTRTSEHEQYHPDFYLPDYDIYIEYFGVNRNGEVPSYFKSKNGLSATEEYRASMEWKRATHNKHQTTMIECYAYEKFEGNLLNNLKEKLEAASVVLTPKSSNELWTQVASEGDSPIDGIIELFETLINLIKSNDYNISTVRKLNQAKGNIQSNSLLLSLLEPIFDAYCQYLSAHKEIDFNDMINLAAKYVRQGKYVNPYKYVIVDEYQDISKARYTLLKCLRESRDFELFCVGDDWQSIYRFAGSDIDFIINFSKYWGATEISKIETTYRFPQKLIEISGGFIMKNPAQIKKSIKGISEDHGFPLGEISGYTQKYAIKFMAKKLADLPRGSSVFFIGRYSFDINILSDSDLFSCQYNKTSGLIDVKNKSRLDLNMVFLTAHKSKGLQADYVFIINNQKSRMGFPSKIQDDPILDLLLNTCDQYPHAEERRLFYVALTRAKKKAFIVTVNGQESMFALELKEKYANELKREQFECPLCGGRLVKHSGPYGEFFGCSNYHKTGCSYKRKIR